MTVSFWLILITALAYGLLHSFLASLKMKTYARYWFGEKADHWFRLVYNIIAIITLIPVLLLPLLKPDQKIYGFPYPWILFTLFIQGLALVALIVSLQQSGITSFLGLRQVFLSDDSSPSKLVIHGLYRYVRHPQYTAGLIFIWLTPYLSWNFLALIIGLTAYILIGAYIEERKLLFEFGEAYVEYQYRTPMLIPGTQFLHRSKKQAN